jgi:hypothetical protein
MRGSILPAFVFLLATAFAVNASGEVKRIGDHGVMVGAGHGGGAFPVSECITKSEQSQVTRGLGQVGVLKVPAGPASQLMSDPMGSGGINSLGKPTNNYVDLDPSSGLKDYTCGTATYDGHAGSDIDLSSFYDMDEGVAILAAAPGTVTFVHDGEFDRNTAWSASSVANAVIVTCSDGTQVYYWHMRKNSVRVHLNDIVQTGDTLGFVGSSGFSTNAHLHFELRDNVGNIIEPYHGTCQTSGSRWQIEKPYIFNDTFKLISQGVTTMPLDWPTILELPPSKTHVKGGDTIYTWITESSGGAADNLVWEAYLGSTFMGWYGFTTGDPIRHGWWYIWWAIPDQPSYYGDWTFKVYRNNVQIGQQSFTYNSSSNQLPVVPTVQADVACTGLTSEFIGSDPDGSIFWYDVTSGPTHGTLSQFGGRKRKFTYTPAAGYVGRDSIAVRARDDENKAGATGYYVFKMNATCCCVGTTGNVNGTGIVDLADLSSLVSYLSIGGFTPPCLLEANINAIGIVDLADLSSLVNYLTTGQFVLPSCR